jgi:predicted esterase
MTKRILSIVITFLMVCIPVSSAPVTNVQATFQNGQVFITWNRILPTNAAYHYAVYRSQNPITSGSHLHSAEYLGTVRHNSSENIRMSAITGSTKYLRIDSASAKLDETKGLFVATSTHSGLYYYAVTMNDGTTDDTTIVFGSNSLISPISENVAMPQPVWQDSWPVGGKTCLHYVQFVTSVTSLQYPLMTNVGSYQCNFAILTSSGPSPHPITFWLHPGGGNFLQTTEGLGIPNEWVVMIDDEVPNSSDYYTMYYGFAKTYNIYSSYNSVPTADTLYNYTSARVVHTIDWCIHHLPVDSTRTYMTGFSLGAIGALFTAMVIPSKIAAIAVFSPKINFGVPFETNIWDEAICARLYGTPACNLPTNEGMARNERLDASYLAHKNRNNSTPILFTFCGKNDYDVDWYEKIPFYSTIEADRLGGFHFWAPTDHGGTAYNSPWNTTFPNFSFFARYRTDQSYPSFSGCTINNHPGNGLRSDGDSVGTINGYLDWEDDIVDSVNRWECTVKIRDLPTAYGTFVVPDSAVTAITLRRLQKFTVPFGTKIKWQNVIVDTTIEQGEFTFDGGMITIPSIRIFKDPHRLVVTKPALSTRITFQQKWNLVSLPVIPSTDSLPLRSSGAQSNPFSYSLLIGYLECPTIKVGKGYWIKFSDSASIELSGYARYADSVDLDEGWNLIGSLSIPIAARNIVSGSDGLAISNLFGYTNNYYIADTMFPGKGYWVKANKRGRILLSDGLSAMLTKGIQTFIPMDLPPLPPNDEDNGLSNMPALFNLSQNYPNPFNPITTIGFTLPLDARVTLKVYDVLGQEVATLLNREEMDEGDQKIDFDASHLASGLYFYSISIEGIVSEDGVTGQGYFAVKKMVLVK